jgi:signal transduction histidine kinase
VLADLDGLVAQSRLAGLSVELSVSGESRRLGGELEGTAYRLVQEALTNVHKHAASARTEVSVEYRERELAVSVVNGPPPSSDRPATELPSGGNGLRGMRERVRSLSGEFEALAVDGGGFRVAAVLPA